MALLCVIVGFSTVLGLCEMQPSAPREWLRGGWNGVQKQYCSVYWTPQSAVQQKLQTGRFLCRHYFVFLTIQIPRLFRTEFSQWSIEVTQGWVPRDCWNTPSPLFVVVVWSDVKGNLNSTSENPLPPRYSMAPPNLHSKASKSF